MSDLFAERFAAVRQRFAAKLDARIADIETAMPALRGGDGGEMLARAHRQAASRPRSPARWRAEPAARRNDRT